MQQQQPILYSNGACKCGLWIFESGDHRNITPIRANIILLLLEHRGRPINNKKRASTIYESAINSSPGTIGYSSRWLYWLAVGSLGKLKQYRPNGIIATYDFVKCINKIINPAIESFTATSTTTVCCPLLRLPCDWTE